MLKQRFLCVCVGGGVVERPSTMDEELTSHVDGVECQERRIIGKSE